MIFPIVFALLLAAVRKYSLKPLLTAYALYPFAFLTLVVIYLQAGIFLHDYTLITYASVIKSAYLMTLIIPFLVYRLFKPGLVGASLIVAGSLLNRLVISQNNGKMPVYATFSKLTGYYSETVLRTVDTVHSVGDSSTRLKFLTDFIDIGYSILSIGDVLIHSFAFIILYFSIKEIHKRQLITE